MKIWKALNKYRELLGLLAVAFVLRIGYFIGNTIPFAFDHGKDSLAIMDMLLNLSPKFIGPWTSIPGLYFGPGWYYLLAPFYLLFGYNPIGGAVIMLLLVLLQVGLAYKYLGKWEAVILSTAPLWFILSKSAWNPYPMTLLSLVLIILLKISAETKKLTPMRALGLGLAASFGFHFSAAFAIFYPIIILAALLIFRIRLTLKSVLFGLLGFAIPFLPHLLFELRYNFSQVRAVLAYFQKGEAHTFGLDKIQSVVATSLGEIRLGILPESNYLGAFSMAMPLLLLGLLIGVAIRSTKGSKEIQRALLLCLLFIAFPIFCFFFLHFNVWYVYAMVPAAVWLVGSLLRRSPFWLKALYISLLFLGPLFAYGQYFMGERELLLQGRGFLPVKLQAIELIQEKAAGRPYASYQYVPDIYDFSYQYIYFWKALEGKPLPVEFTYQPGEHSYVVQKPELLQHFPIAEGPPEVLFYIVEKPENEEFLSRWWDAQQFSAIEETIELSPEVTLYVARP